MTDFLWHTVNEKEKEEIKKEAKRIMDSFSRKLEKISEKIPEPVVERNEYEREEGKGEKVEIERKIMFDNAPEHNNDFIIAERKEW